MWPVVVAVIAVIPSAHQNHPALSLNTLGYCEANSGMGVGGAMGELIAARMAPARQLGILRNPSCFIVYRQLLEIFYNLHWGF